MTKPTQAQIEAAYQAIRKRMSQPFKYDEASLRELAEAALTAAAEVGDEKDWRPKCKWRCVYCGMDNAWPEEIEAATIERCAQVATDLWRVGPGKDYGKALAVAIRALKDKPPTDPNIIYPGKDLTNVFPEEDA